VTANTSRGPVPEPRQARASASTSSDNWTTYGGDLASRRYRPYDQITGDNFKDLEIAWRFKADSLGPRPEFNFQATPLVVNGVMYTPFGTRRDVVALDAATGEMLWMHREDEGKRGDAAPRKLAGRGVAYWSDGRDSRIVYVTPGYQLTALDAKTGARVESFGNKGIVDLKRDDDQIVDLETGEIGLHATPLIAKDVIVVGAAHLPGGAPKNKVHEKGFIRGFDVRTGKRLWIFHTIPEDGEFGRDTWEKDAATYTGNAGVWAQMTADEELGLVYLPVEMPTGDYYGGHRPGAGLFGESLVALDIKTGSAAGITSSSTTGSGTSTSRRRRFSPTSRWMAVASRRLRSRRNRAGSTSSIARPVNRCGRSKNGGSPAATCRGSGIRRRSRT